jgi:hypothetical protein
MVSGVSIPGPNRMTFGWLGFPQSRYMQIHSVEQKSTFQVGTMVVWAGLLVLVTSWVGRGEPLHYQSQVQWEHCMFEWILWKSNGGRQQPTHM